MEVFSGTRQFSRLRGVSQTRSKPFMLHTGDDNAIIFSASDEHGDTISHIIVDRIYGESFTVPLFSTWLPKYQHHAPHSDDCRTEAGTYLIAVEDSTGQAAIARVQDEDFQLLATEGPLPMVSHGQRISYFGSIVCDRRAGRAYMVGYSDDRCLYVLSVAYGHEPASLTLYRSEPQPSIVMYTPVLTDEGHIALVGGTRESNFTPVSTALLLCVGSDDHAETTTATQSRMWPWIAGAFVVLVIVVAAWLYARRRLRTAGKPEACPVQEEQQTVESNESSEADLITQINMLMEQEQLFRDSDLKIQDVANRLNTNRTYISDCIKAQYGLSFTQYVNNCRVEYAKQILAKNPDKKMLIVAAEAGFTTDVWFFHTFKAITGVTPTEWKAKQAEK
jgi:AraC-like DNA-binding protein